MELIEPYGTAINIISYKLLMIRALKGWTNSLFSI